ncbi:MAG TPA: FAD-dependent oxidoreductase [Candidatus Cybelea sp.]|nr:FAD-dependent oxidoreductase [Candidatus Cybelea sp.]
MWRKQSSSGCSADNLRNRLNEAFPGRYSSGMERLETRCCIAGGGPAGMMLGYLLARAGVDVVVLEKHADFLRDFRGDTIHPSTLEVIHELGLLDEFLKLPHQKLERLAGNISGETFFLADFTHLPTHCKYIVFMPQWDFLNFLERQGRQLPSFRLRMETEVVDLAREGTRVSGVRAKTPAGEIEVRAGLVVAADGRHSTVRSLAGLEVEVIGAPIDVLWMRLSRQPSDPPQTLGRMDRGRIFVTLDRGDYWQCAYVIPKGGFEKVRSEGLPAFRSAIVAIAKDFRDRIGELRDWDDIKLLSVAVDRLKQWHVPGLLCIGDAAHAMSPVGGIGINLAVQDAVAAANILAADLRRGTPADVRLAEVQSRREWPARVTQRFQVLVQNRIIGRVLRAVRPFKPPRIVRAIGRCTFLQRIPARLIGMGVRPEHIRATERSTM